MRKLLTILGLCTVVAGCTSMSESFKQIHAGMDKGEVLQILDNPKFTFREDSQDHWAYFYHSNGQEWRRDVIFENGKVIRVTRPTAKEKWQKDIESSSSIEEYEHIAREHQKRSSNFKSIGGDSDGDTKSQ